MLSKEILVPKTATKRPLLQRPGVWGIIATVLLLLAAAAISILNSLVYSPEAAVEEYVDALRAGDGSRATALSQAYLPNDAPDTMSTVLLDGEPLATSAALLADAEIIEVDAEVPERAHDEQRTQRVVEIQFQDAAEESRSTSIVVDHVGTSWLFFNQWAIHPMPIQQVELHPSQMPDGSKVDEPVAHVNDQPTPLLGPDEQPATLAAFAPSSIELEYEGTYLEVAEPQQFVMTDVLAAGATSDFDIDISLTQAVDDAITEEVQQQLQRCTQQTVLQPAGCPFGYQTTNRVQPDTVSWSIDVPDVEYSWENSDPTINWIMATATLTAQEIDIGTGQETTVEYEEIFEMSAQLELTPENIRVWPDWQ